MSTALVLYLPPSAGARIASLADLHAAARERRSVICPHYPLGRYSGWRQRMPAAWAMNLQGTVLHRLIASGMYIYVPKNQRKKEPTK